LRRARLDEEEGHMSVDIEFLSAVIVISDEPQRLAEFYREALGLPLRPGAA
jgi:hypothetical protein